MEEKILNVLRENPGSRLSTVAWLISENKMKVLDALYSLEDQGKVYRKSHHDAANMEFYNMWYAK